MKNVKRQLGRRTRSLLAGAGTVVLALGVLTLLPSGANAAISGSLYVDPDTGGARWVAVNSGDRRANLIKSKIAGQPQARWLTNANAGQMATAMSSHIAAANAQGKIPTVVYYALPNRDCGGASAGGAKDLNAPRRGCRPCRRPWGRTR